MRSPMPCGVNAIREMQGGHSGIEHLQLNEIYTVWSCGPCHSCRCHLRLYLPPGPPRHSPKPVVAVPRGVGGSQAHLGAPPGGTASEVCRLWLPAVGMAVAAAS